MWGTRTSDRQQLVKDELRDQNIRVACIGPAGENLARVACIINERRAVGRKGLGAVMGSMKLKAIAVRGVKEVPVYDQESFKLNYVTSYTGADHNRGYAFQEIFGIPVPEAVDRFAVEGKGKLTMWNQDVRTATCDCPTMCAFLLDMAVPDIATQNTASLLKSLTGLEFTPEDVQLVGERVNNLARAYNNLTGFGREDDTFPERILTEPIREGNSRGQLISREELDRMLDEYYEARGWTSEGIPKEEKLRSLGLDKAAEMLWK
jgi:aldehyde:ferredoxin oxidoreductase